MHSKKNHNTKIKNDVDRYGQGNCKVYDWMQKSNNKQHRKWTCTKSEKTDKNVNKLIRDRQMTCAFNGHIVYIVQYTLFARVYWYLAMTRQHAHSHIHIFTQVKHACQSRINIIFQSYIHWYVHISFMDTNWIVLLRTIEQASKWAIVDFSLVHHHLLFLIRLFALCVHALLCCFIDKVTITCFFDCHIMIFVSRQYFKKAANDCFLWLCDPPSLSPCLSSIQYNSIWFRSILIT